METFLQLVVPILSAAFAAGGAYAAVRVELHWIRRELDDHDGEIRTLHGRINDLLRATRD